MHLGYVKNAQRCTELCAPHPHSCMINSQLKVRAEPFPTTCPNHGWLKETEELFCCTAVNLKGISQFPARNFHCFPVIESLSLIASLQEHIHKIPMRAASQMRQQKEPAQPKFQSLSSPHTRNVIVSELISHLYCLMIESSTEECKIMYF